MPHSPAAPGGRTVPQGVWPPWGPALGKGLPPSHSRPQRSRQTRSHEAPGLQSRPHSSLPARPAAEPGQAQVGARWCRSSSRAARPAGADIGADASRCRACTQLLRWPGCGRACPALLRASCRAAAAPCHRRWRDGWMATATPWPTLPLAPASRCASLHRASERRAHALYSRGGRDGSSIPPAFGPHCPPAVLSAAYRIADGVFRT
mmetsp:Transcript_51342/g.164402  ORF Transcript_51342/g.164402 Transcript_51342/m.164402 type:complete len:206 (-) Transcript_51342:17-634(-)